MYVKNLIAKNKLQKYMDTFLLIFLIIQPVFDLKIFYNSISTLIRVLVIGSLFLIYFSLSSNKKKFWLILYPFLIIVYFIFHHINTLNFNSLVPGNFNYSILEEILYLIKMITPFLLIYVLYKSNLDYNKILKTIKLIVIIIGLTIIISNIFLFSYGSYSDKQIKANFFTWFTDNNFTYQDLASKGLFEYANQISAILLMFLPFCLISALDDKRRFDLFVLIINIFSLFLLSTKVAVLGVFLVFIYTLTIYIFDKKVIKKEKLLINSLATSLITLIFYVLIVSNNPIFMRIDETKTIETSVESIQQGENNIEPISNTYNSNEESSSDDIINYIAQNYTEKQLKEEFITQSYPYEYDPEFWISIFNEPLSNRVNYRFIEQSMVNRVLEINNNKYDKYVGISNTRLQNIFNLERDFTVQFYSLGIIGLLLVFLPYFIILALYIYNILKSKFKYFNVINSISFTTILLLFAVSYFSGNLLNSLSFTIYFSLLFVLIFNNKINTPDDTIKK